MGRPSRPKASQSSCRRSPQSHWQHQRREWCDIEGRLGGCECGTRPCDCVCARVHGNGCVQLRFLCTDPGVPAYLKSLVNGADADAAYSAFLTFKDVVKKNQVASAGASATVPSGDKIGAAAKKLSDASYPFLKEIDWTSDLFMKPLPGASASQALKAVDKAIVMGSAMDGNLLKAAAEAHHKAIGSIDGKGVTSAADYEAVNAALGRVVASVPTAKVMDVYNGFAGLVNPAVPNKLFSTVNALDANAAAKAFYEFKDVVKAAQR